MKIQEEQGLTSDQLLVRTDRTFAWGSIHKIYPRLLSSSTDLWTKLGKLSCCIAETRSGQFCKLKSGWWQFYTSQTSYAGRQDPIFSRLIYFQPWCDQKLLTWQKSILKMSVTSALRNRSYRWRGIVKQRSLNCRHLNGLYIIHKSTPTLGKVRLISQQTDASGTGRHIF